MNTTIKRATFIVTSTKTIGSEGTQEYESFQKEKGKGRKKRYTQEERQKTVIHEKENELDIRS